MENYGEGMWLFKQQDDTGGRGPTGLCFSDGGHARAVSDCCER